MTQSADPPPTKHFARRNPLAWLIFACGLILIPLVFVVASFSSHPAHDWDTSFFGHHLARPLLILGFCCCCSSPFWTRASTLLKFVLAVTAAVIFGVLLVLGVVVLFFVSPSMV